MWHFTTDYNILGFEKSGTAEANIYYDPEMDKSKMEAAEAQPKQKKQWGLFGASKKPSTEKTTDELPPPAYENQSLDTDVTANPVYGQSWVAFDESTDVSASVTLENPTYDSAQTTDNPYEVDV